MFGIDFSEILVIFGIALVVLGPERLPKLANTIGRWIGRARAMARQFRDQLESETHTLHQGMDLGPDFSGRPGARPGTGGAVARPSANSSTASAPEGGDNAPPSDPRHPGVAPAASGTLPPTMVGPPLPPMGLADTFPAAFHPYVPPPAPELPATGVAASTGSEVPHVAPKETAPPPPDAAA